MQKLGYSDAKPLQIKIQTRNLPTYRDPAVISDRPAQEDLHRRRTRHSRYAALVREAGEEGLHDRPERHRRQRRRSRRQYRRELFLQLGAQLHPVLQRRGRQAAGGAIARARQGKAQENGLGYRAASWSRTPRGPIILHCSAGNCWQPHVKNFKPHDNSQYNNLRFEDVWLDK